MKDNSVFYSAKFMEKLNKYCSQLFIDANLSFFADQNIHLTNCINCIDITEYIRCNNGVQAMDKVRFCLAWLNTFWEEDNTYVYGMIIIDNCMYNYLRHTDFTSYLQLKEIITQEEQNAINKEWLDFTDGEPYYSLQGIRNPF